jgi:multisubunit Na+/H+ antiporter MnhC subunit
MIERSPDPIPPALVALLVVIGFGLVAILVGQALRGPALALLEEPAVGLDTGAP